jgi:hypothetical protein
MTISSGTLRTLREFWSEFGRLPLYDTGFDEAIKGCGAHSAETQEKALVAMAYLKGYADCARLACPYMGPSWRIAHSLGCAAGTFTAALQDDAFGVIEADRLIRVYRAELADLCRQKNEAAERGLNLGAS